MAEDPAADPAADPAEALKPPKRNDCRCGRIDHFLHK